MQFQAKHEKHKNKPSDCPRHKNMLFVHSLNKTGSSLISSGGARTISCQACTCSTSSSTAAKSPKTTVWRQKWNPGNYFTTINGISPKQYQDSTTTVFLVALTSRPPPGWQLSDGLVEGSDTWVTKDWCLMFLVCLVFFVAELQFSWLAAWKSLCKLLQPKRGKETE